MTSAAADSTESVRVRAQCGCCDSVVCALLLSASMRFSMADEAGRMHNQHFPFLPASFTRGIAPVFLHKRSTSKVLSAGRGATSRKVRASARPRPCDPPCIYIIYIYICHVCLHQTLMNAVTAILALVTENFQTSVSLPQSQPWLTNSAGWSRYRAWSSP